MKEEEKAKELIEKFGKELALICCDEIIRVCPYISKEDADTLQQIRANDSQFMSYWQAVKEAIKKY